MVAPTLHTPESLCNHLFSLHSIYMYLKIYEIILCYLNHIIRFINCITSHVAVNANKSFGF